MAKKNVKEIEKNIHSTGEVIDFVYKKNTEYIEILSMKQPVKALLEVLPLPQHIDKQEKQSITIDYPSYKKALEIVLNEINYNENIEQYYDEVIEKSIDIFVDSVIAKKYQYAFVEDEGKVLDGKRVYNVVRNGDIELIKTMIDYCPSLLKEKKAQIDILAERDPEVKEKYEAYEKAMQDEKEQ